MNKTEILKLVSDFKSDSKKKSEKAKKELIKICEPIIKKYFDISKEYGNTEVCGWNEDYLSTRGELTEFIGYGNNILTFYYEDGCLGNHYECEVEMPFEWLDSSYEKTYRELCKEKNIMLINREIAEQEEKTNKLKDKLKSLKAKE